MNQNFSRYKSKFKNKNEIKKKKITFYQAKHAQIFFFFR